VTLTLTGARIKALLEQQWSKPEPNICIHQRNFCYAWDAARPAGDRVLEITLDGRAIEPDARYRVTVNGFLAAAATVSTVFAEGTERQTGGADIDALAAYLTPQSFGTRALDRIRRVN